MSNPQQALPPEQMPLAQRCAWCGAEAFKEIQLEKPKWGNKTRQAGRSVPACDHHHRTIRRSP